MRPGGQRLLDIDQAAGPYFTRVQPNEDETVVRAKAYEAIRAAVAAGLLAEALELIYDAPYKIADFAAFKDAVIAVDEARRPRFEAKEAELRAAFEATAERRDGGYVLDQPSRLNLLRKAT